jgi:L-asparaginase
MENVMALPILAIGALGGTVSMQAQTPGAGVVPEVGAEQMFEALPQLRDMAWINAETLQLLPSASLEFSHLLDVLAWARLQVAEGAHGVVLTQGTDTLEESAYFLDLVWDSDAPLVLTGAMRAASQVSADGPANLLAAAAVALADSSRKRGVLVVMNDQVHAAAHVRKVHTLALDAFKSPGRGPLGVMVEGRVHYHAAPGEREILPLPRRTDHKVALFEASLGADTLLLDRVVELGYAGLVIAGFGAWHVSQIWAEVLGDMCRYIPVVVGSRTGAGATASHSYGFVGGEIDLQGRGALMAGTRCPRKSRIKLWLMLGSQDRDGVCAHW